MGNYTLNSIDLEDYGIYASQAQNSNLALTGCFDLPKREGDTYYSWDDEDTVEPYVDEDDINFEGRDLTFYGFMKENRRYAYEQLQSLYTSVKAFAGLVPFATPYGTFQVYVVSITPSHLRDSATVIIKFREPTVDLSGGSLPDIASGNLRLDKIPLSSFGLYVSAQKDRTALQKLKKQYFTAFGFEGFQATKRDPGTLSLEGFIVASDTADFIAKIKALYAIFSASGLRTFDLSGEVEAKVFADQGFSVTNVEIGSRVIARFTMKLTISEERFYTSTDFYYTFPLVFPFSFGTEYDENGFPIVLT